MYICKDCGNKYPQKVEYCDCGNNTFDFVEDVVSQKVERQPLSIEQKSKIVSVVFFVLCLFLSLIVWLIPIKQPAKVENKVENKVKTIEDKNIPTIDKIWDDTPVYVAPKPVAKVEEPVRTINLDEILNPFKKNENKVVQPQRVVQKPVQKVVQKTEPKVEVKKPVNVPKNTMNAASQAGQQTKNTQKPVQTKPAQQSSWQNVKPAQKVQPIQPEKPKYNPNSPEMLSYKGNLRGAMFKKFPVGSIQGSGSCSVKFAVDSTGKLINRGFIKTSDNKSLNDAVYYMMMSVPRYNVPPEGYNGEMIRMDFKIDNGSYEISIY